MSEQATTPSNTDGGLLRAIGTWGLAAGIVNVTVGGGIFRLPASPDVTGRLGAAAPLAYIACAIVMGLIVLCIAEAGSRISLTGGPYAYVEMTFGRYVGFLVGVMLWLIGATAIPGVAGLFADAAARLIPALDSTAGRALFRGHIDQHLRCEAGDATEHGAHRREACAASIVARGGTLFGGHAEPEMDARASDRRPLARVGDPDLRVRRRRVGVGAER